MEDETKEVNKKRAKNNEKEVNDDINKCNKRKDGTYRISGRRLSQTKAARER